MPPPAPPISTPPVPPSSKASRDGTLGSLRAAEKRRARVRLIAITSGIVGAAAVITLVLTSITLTTRPTATESAGGSIRGVTTYSNTAGHVEGSVSYDQTPPVGGPHNRIWLNCGIYTQPVPNENAVHDLEHGAVWVTYDPSLPAATVSSLRDLMPSTYTLLSPYPGLPAPIVLSAWNAQLTVSTVTDARIGQFFEKYRQSASAPEPKGPCTGGLDAPGKL